MKLLLSMRTSIGSRLQSLSNDGGETWSEPQRVELPNPFQGCEGSMVSVNRDLILYSGVGSGTSGSTDSGGTSSVFDPRRMNLFLFESKDQGSSWQEN